MFPFEQNDEFLSQISYNPPQEDIIREDLLLGQASIDGSNLTNLTGSGEPHNIVASANINNPNLISSEKKIIRKEIERQRRQQMSALHASLRSLLPLVSVKGKRSISDHVHEAANYIKHLKNNIQELSDKRDKLKDMAGSSNLEHGYESSEKTLQTSVTVRPYLGGVEIVITSGYGEDGFLLSKVLKAVLEEGFDVVSSLTTRKDERLYNTLQCQTSDMTCTDLPRLQQKLNDVILSSRFLFVEV